MTERKYTVEEGRERLAKVKKHRQFNIIKDLHGQIKFLDPDESKISEAVRNSFIHESNFADSRQEIKLMLIALRDLIKESGSVEEFAAKGQEKVAALIQILKDNEQKILAETAKYEKPLRQLDLFYKNTGQEKLDDLSILVYNENLLKKDPDDELYKALDREVSKRFEAVDQGESVGYIVCPTFPGSELLARFAGLAEKNRTLFVTNYRDDLTSVADTFSFLEMEKIGGPSTEWSHVVVFANTILAKDGMKLSPAAAVGGRMYVTKISQPVAGYMHSSLKGVSELAFNVTDPEVTLFKGKGIIPLLNAWEQDMPFGMWTTYKGPNEDFQQYAIVRVRDWIARCLNDHLRKCVFNLTEKKVLREINRQVADFLKKISKAGIIEEGSVEFFDRNNASPDRIDIQLAITYLYAIRLFTYKFISSRDRAKEQLDIE
ncbi:hypothetical protein [Flavilitoribacter nigricans]|uniref:Tail sheath protein C-terminal domain-containing protein n=1 Tax=Flavilitoribacter nigricans (strain ATCC 23147 / DSM 23189 / NBRC 102662 / NCIMB 1420 / SS-2) TaxID=1122177 RepID=A0A2D0NAC1_FLAN2|nr:hypothetical protein [Flavilitoribacter nigricans]PHN05109.1 hypothetical protein CRP01_18990 [Flavilitoribacter nigricans DSM 23189 = NBRC 102662]